MTPNPKDATNETSGASLPGAVSVARADGEAERATQADYHAIHMDAVARVLRYNRLRDIFDHEEAWALSKTSDVLGLVDLSSLPLCSVEKGATR